MDRVVVVHVDTKDDQDKGKKGNDYATGKEGKVDGRCYGSRRR